MTSSRAGTCDGNGVIRSLPGVSKSSKELQSVKYAVAPPFH